MKKFNKILSLALVLVMVLSLVPAITFGTAAETWKEVDTLDELKTELAAGGNIKITAATLDFADTTDYYNMPVANGTVLDANGCVFTGVNIAVANDGLFSLLGTSANGGTTIKNLVVGSEGTPAVGMRTVMVGNAEQTAAFITFENVTVYATLHASSHAGVFGGYMTGSNYTFKNCHVYATITSTANTGGFLGRYSGTATFTDCSANGTFEVSANVGGYIGCVNDASTIHIENCVNNATINNKSGGNGHNASGFIGQDRSTAAHTTLLACTNNGVVSSTWAGTKLAEFAGSNQGGQSEVAYAALTPRAETTLDNFIGYGKTTEVAYAGVNNANDLVTKLAAGGTVKLLSNIDMTGKENITVAANTVLDGNGKKLTNVAVTGNNGLFNFGDGKVTIQNLTIEGTGANSFLTTWAMNPDGNPYRPTVTLNNVDLIATLTATAENGAVAGKIGGQWTITNCDVTVTNDAPGNHAGGYFGRFYGYARFENCTANGTISNSTGRQAGFIAVANGDASFIGCTNNLDITSEAPYAAAGFVAELRGTQNATLLNCTNTGDMPATKSAEFVRGWDGQGNLYYGNLTGASAVVDYDLLVSTTEVLYDWAQLQTAGEYKIGPAHPAIAGEIPVASGVTIDGLGNTLTWSVALNSLFVLPENATFTVKNLNVGSASSPNLIYGALIWTVDGSAQSYQTLTDASSTTTTTWENVHVYATITCQTNNTGAFLSGKAFGTHTFIDCSAMIAEGSVSVNSTLGAFVGRNCGNMTFIRCTAEGKINTANPGAFIGKSDSVAQGNKPAVFIDCVSNAKLANGTDVENFCAVADTSKNTYAEGTNWFVYTTPQLKAVQETAAADGVQKIRFLAAMGQNGIVDEATAKASPINFGFVVTAVVNGDEKFADRTFTLNNLYSAVTATENGETVSVTAGDLGCAYLAALVLTGVPAEGTVVFTITPWMTYAEGAEALEGTTYTVTYTDGAFVSATPEGVTNPEL